MAERSLRGQVVIAGIGETTYYKHGQSPDSEFKLALQAILAAARDAGIDPRDIDGFASWGPWIRRDLTEEDHQRKIPGRNRDHDPAAAQAQFVALAGRAGHHFTRAEQFASLGSVVAAEVCRLA